MRNYLIKLLDRIEVPKYAHKPVIETFDKIKQEDIDYVLCKYADENVEYVTILNDWHYNITRIYKLPELLSALVFSLIMCKKLEEIYDKKGLPKELFIKTMKGISVSVEECKVVKKEIGTAIAWWFDDFFRLRRFSFGRLQVELAHFGHTYKDDKYDLGPYMACLSVHVPRTGERLDPIEAEKSLELSRKFFAPYFNNQPILFKFESWLIHTSTLKLASPDSNIAKFAKRFIIFKQRDDLDISEMWRLFDEEVNVNNLDKLPTNTSLRRKFVEYLKQGGKIGEGYGFYIK